MNERIDSRDEMRYKRLRTYCSTHTGGGGGKGYIPEYSMRFVKSTEKVV